jgi:hypothetical protein
MRLKQPALATRHLPSTRIVIIQIVALRLVARRSTQRSLNLGSEWRGAPRADGGSLTAWGPITGSGSECRACPSKQIGKRQGTGCACARRSRSRGSFRPVSYGSRICRSMSALPRVRVLGGSRRQRSRREPRSPGRQYYRYSEPRKWSWLLIQRQLRRSD